MALVTTRELFADAQKNGYAIGAFNVENMEMVQAVAAAAEELKAPVIMQTTPSTVKYADLKYFYANAKAAAEMASVPIVMHLDHGNSFDLAMRALRVGYTSIMIDGSHAIREVVTIPLVRHGTSGVPDDIVRECVRRGICKVSYATDLRIAFSKGVKAYMQEDPDVFDPKKYNARGREEVKQYVMSKILVCGSDGRA